MAHDAQHFWDTVQYAKDVGDLVLSAKVLEHMQGQMRIFALGGAARRLFDGLPSHEKQHVVELDDGNGGLVRFSSVELLLRARQDTFPSAPGSPNVATRG